MDQSMQALRLRLSNTKSRPMFRYQSGEAMVVALMDTGAETPVWCGEGKDLLRAYPDAVKKDEVCELSGFGKGTVTANVYVLPEFRLENEGKCYRIKNLQIMQCFRPDIGCDFVLSDTMFSNVDTLIYRHGKKCIDICYYNVSFTPNYTKNSFT